MKTVEWISVKDHMPETHSTYAGGPERSDTVLTFNGNYVSIGETSETYSSRVRKWYDRNGRVARDITHWAIMPKGPEVKQ